MVKILDGTLEQRKIQTALQDGTKTLLNTYNIQPKLAVILVGNHAPSLLYVEKKQAFAKGVGIETVLFHLSSGASLEEALALIKALNQDKGVHGILLQLPTPSSIDSKCLIETIDPLKDVDGLHPINMGKLIQGQEAFYPCTPQGCLHLIRQWKQNLGGLVAVVVGRSSLVGKPIATMLLKENATVIQAHSYTKNLKDITRLADILVVAVGKPHLIKEDFVKEGACVIDVGISKNDQEQTVGDVNFQMVKNHAGAISLVPGGVGPMTIAYLMLNTFKACCIFHNISWKKILSL